MAEKRKKEKSNDDNVEISSSHHEQSNQAVQTTEPSTQLNTNQMSTLEQIEMSLDPSTILSGDIAIEAMDKLSVLMNLLPPQILYLAELQGYTENITFHRSDVHVIQIHFVDSHYVVSEQKNGVISVYDSLPNRNRVKQLLPQLKLIYLQLNECSTPEAKIFYKIGQLQGKSNDCGAFAAANAVLLHQGIDPPSVYLKQHLLRQHLLLILQSNTVSSFPLDENQSFENVQLSSYFTNQMKSYNIEVTDKSKPNQKLYSDMVKKILQPQSTRFNQNEAYSDKEQGIKKQKTPDVREKELLANFTPQHREHKVQKAQKKTLRVYTDHQVKQQMLHVRETAQQISADQLQIKNEYLKYKPQNSIKR